MEPLAFDLGRFFYSLFFGEKDPLPENFKKAKGGDAKAWAWLKERHAQGDPNATAALRDLDAIS